MKKGLISVLTAFVLSICLLFTACEDTTSNGKSAYDLAVKNGFSGSEQQWLASLKGEKGDPGEKGDKGDPGIRGTKFLTGKGNPSKDIGDDLMEGDLYLDYDDGYIWSYQGNKWNALNISEDEFLDAESLKSEFDNGNDITLRNDITLTENDILNVGVGETVDFDLGGMTVDFGGNGTGDLAGIKVSGTLTISNGTINFGSTTSKEGFSQTKSPIVVESGATLTLNDVDFVSTTTSGILAKADSTVNINDSRITTMAYCVGTNAAPDGYGAPKAINIQGSSLTSSNENGDATPLLVNVRTNVTISDSTITGDRQAVILRGCNATIENSTLESTGKFTLDESVSNDYLESDWKSGNEVPYATLVIGNRGTGYSYPTTVTLKKVTLITPDTKNSDPENNNTQSGSETDKETDGENTDNNNGMNNETTLGGDTKNNSGISIGNGNAYNNGYNNNDKNYMRYNGNISIANPDNYRQNTIADRNEVAINDSDVTDGDVSDSDADEEDSVTVLPLYVYANSAEGNGVTLIMDDYTEAQAGKKFIYSENVTYSKDSASDDPQTDISDDANPDDSPKDAPDSDSSESEMDGTKISRTPYVYRIYR